MLRLTDKTAIVTGSARGIGAAIALRFAEEGAKVVVNAVTHSEQAARVVTDIREAGGEAIAVTADVSKRDDVERLVGETIDVFGGLHILVSNAGIIIDKPFLENEETDWDRAIAINLRGFSNTCHAALLHMIDQGWGRVIATGSVIADLGDFGEQKMSACAAAKGGIAALARHVAAEVAGYGVTVNVVSPGYIQTDMAKQSKLTDQSGVLERIPVGRFGRPSEIAAAMAFLASDEAAYITGQNLRVNGGMSMQ